MTLTKNKYELVILLSQYSDINQVLSAIGDGFNNSSEFSSNALDEISEDKKPFFSIIKNEFWGKRNLAYKINKIKKADYHVVYFEANSQALKLIERKLKMNQDIIRFLVLKISELPISNPPIMAGLLTSDNVNYLKNNKELGENSEITQEELDHNNEQIALNWISYKNPDLLLRYISDIYLISSRRFNGLSSLQQRILKREISRARFLAILPFTVVRRR